MRAHGFVTELQLHSSVRRNTRIQTHTEPLSPTCSDVRLELISLFCLSVGFPPRGRIHILVFVGFWFETFSTC